MRTGSRTWRDEGEDRGVEKGERRHSRRSTTPKGRMAVWVTARRMNMQRCALSSSAGWTPSRRSARRWLSVARRCSRARVRLRPRPDGRALARCAPPCLSCTSATGGSGGTAGQFECNAAFQISTGRERGRSKATAASNASSAPSRSSYSGCGISTPWKNWPERSNNSASATTSSGWSNASTSNPCGRLIRPCLPSSPQHDDHSKSCSGNRVRNRGAGVPEDGRAPLESGLNIFSATCFGAPRATDPDFRACRKELRATGSIHEPLPH